MLGDGRSRLDLVFLAYCPYFYRNITNISFDVTRVTGSSCAVGAVYMLLLSVCTYVSRCTLRKKNRRVGEAPVVGRLELSLVYNVSGVR